MARLPAIPLLLLATLACGCGAGNTATVPARCHVRGPLPDPRCTPGAIDPHVSQQNIHGGICLRGYTSRVRPSQDYTQRLKRIQMAHYGFYAGRSPRAYEEDHLIPLELGGAPTDPRNLWPQRRARSADSDAKDAEENLLHHRVCERDEALAAAQQEMASDWYAAYRRDRPDGG